ncbi:MAG: hypothetical protein JOY64_36265, partial [Alphaproteobacteria bacterium]|nr:hypothetical protein [Alphaproteobacteria bacterium]
MATIQNSSYLDFTSYRSTNQTTVQSAYNLQASQIAKLSGSDAVDLNVAIVLPRAADPTSLLAENWGTREQTLTSLANSGQLWATYGTDPTAFSAVKKDIKDDGLTVLDSSNSDYVTSAESQTIWVEINTAAEFKKLFGTDPYLATIKQNSSFVFWNGNLDLPAAWNVQGLWFDTTTHANPSNLVGNVAVTLPQGPQGIGNSTTDRAKLAPQAIGQLYDLPLIGQSYATAPIGLIEPGIGNALPSGASGSFQQLLAQYLAAVGETGSGTVFVQGEDGQQYSGSAGERSLDVGVVSAVNPNSTIWLYDGSGNNGNAGATTYTALQSAVYYSLPGQQMPAVYSTSFSDNQRMDPLSPFYYAYSQLFVDAALANKTVFAALGDGGSGAKIGNGLTNMFYSETSAYVVLVGGTSISSFVAAQSDPTLDPTFVTQALALNPATIWQLVAGGLTSLPQDTAQLQDFIETVWNQYFVSGTTITNSYQENWTGAGGVDPTQGVPAYQQNFGLNPVTSDPLAQSGRGAPDVSANSEGNTGYVIPNGAMAAVSSAGGTSAASPLWASLAVQLNYVFNDQGLPNLGYMNDLLYLAAAVAPASFNDVTVGSDTSSFTLGGPYTSGGQQITPTGFGYSAAPGYDLASGLGTPNGELLARTMSEVAHAQIYFPNEPAVIDANGAGGWTSGAT